MFRRRVAFVMATALVALGLVPAQPALAANGGEAVVANILWRVKVGSRPDMMTTVTAAERNSWPNDGQIYYLPRNQVSGTAPLYRLFHGNWYGHMNHMDSRTAGEAGFQTEAPVGYAYTSASGAQGLSQYRRTFNSCNGDHGSRSVHEPLPATCIGDELLAAYGWPRFAHQASSMLSLSGGGVTIESNRVAGGAVFTWTHGGVQYLNYRDFGRELQSSVFFSHNGQTANPTEAGDMWTDWDRPAWARHGSPVAAASNDNATLTQITRSVPVDFNPNRFGGDADHPVVWKDIQLGKNITLNWGGLGPVARYQTVYHAPSQSDGYIEVPTAYLRAEFNRFYTYNAISRQIGEVTNQVPNNCPDSGTYYKYIPPNRGGVIISNWDGTRAMGVYGANTSAGGSVSEMLLGNFIGGGCGNGTGATDFATSKWSVIRKGGFGSGTKVFTTYLMTGSVTAVTGYMNQLAAWGNA